MLNTPRPVTADFDTRSSRKTPFLREEKDYVIVNEDLEYAFPAEDLEYIKDFVGERRLDTIAHDLKRSEWEVLWAYVHLVRKGYTLPKIAVWGL